jgi:hypothetical protein
MITYIVNVNKEKKFVQFVTLKKIKIQLSMEFVVS